MNSKLHSDDQQFHQYIKRKITSHLNSLSINKMTTCDVGNPAQASDRHKNVTWRGYTC